MDQNQKTKDMLDPFVTGILSHTLVPGQKGGEGSGNFDHAGRPGQVGGSAGSGGGGGGGKGDGKGGGGETKGIGDLEKPGSIAKVTKEMRTRGRSSSGRVVGTTYWGSNRDGSHNFRSTIHMKDPSATAKDVKDYAKGRFGDKISGSDWSIKVSSIVNDADIGNPFGTDTFSSAEVMFRIGP